MGYGENGSLALCSQVSRSLFSFQISFIVVISMDASTSDGLANHAETLSDYLYEYGGQPDKRNDYSQRFFDYLLSACWRKLHRRFCSWQGLGLIRSFEERVDLLKKHLNIIGTLAGPSKTFRDRGPGDRTLTFFLYKNKHIIFDKMLPSVLSPDMRPQQPRSPAVFNDFREAVVNAYHENDLAELYTEKTALGFHYLVYCAFLLAGQAIRGIKDCHDNFKLVEKVANRKEEYDDKVKVFKDRILAAVLPMKLLQCVLSSTVFKNHIGVWTNDGESLEQLLPKWGEKKANVEFGIKRRILGSRKLGPSGKSSMEGGDEGGDIPKKSRGPTEDDGNEEDESEVCKPI